jgi:hypothetical protein
MIQIESTCSLSVNAISYSYLMALFHDMEGAALAEVWEIVVYNLPTLTSSESIGSWKDISVPPPLNRADGPYALPQLYPSPLAAVGLYPAVESPAFMSLYSKTPPDILYHYLLYNLIPGNHKFVS